MEYNVRLTAEGKTKESELYFPTGVERSQADFVLDSNLAAVIRAKDLKLLSKSNNEIEYTWDAHPDTIWKISIVEV